VGQRFSSPLTASSRNIGNLPGNPLLPGRKERCDFFLFRLVPSVSDPLTACRRPVRTRPGVPSRLLFFVRPAFSISSGPAIVELEIVSIGTRRYPLSEHAPRESPFLSHPPSRQPARLDLALHGKQRHPKKLGRFLRGEDLRFVVTRQRANPSALGSHPTRVSLTFAAK
jgi:hypothetical protein